MSLFWIPASSVGDEMPDTVAQCVLEAYNRLPAHGKPIIRANGVREWTTLAGVVLEDTKEKKFTCVDLSTGVKCTPISKIEPNQFGSVLHDCHAEVLALRCFNRLLLEHCRSYNDEPSKAWLLEKRNEKKFCLKPNLKLHLYVSECPCGDASMELLANSLENSEPWNMASLADQPMRGRTDFGQLGIVRTKPGRADAPFSWSKSCSDKISSKQYLSILNAQTSLLIEPIYLSSLVLPESAIVNTSMKRAFGPSGRCMGLLNQVSGNYTFQPFQVLATKKKFSFSKLVDPGIRIATSTNVLIWIGNQLNTTQVIHNGIQAGKKAKDTDRSQTIISRKAMMRILQDVQHPSLEKKNYEEWKRTNADRQRAKEVVRGVLKYWTCNGGDNFDWSA
ncbi:tRNA specific adenosine deaminase [Schizosaccharomyces cryophilus OY26]|uniref:tRNA specific adenosine deaminase n=1 Tax=Schizosaccharomyces cryophilus (strain OY26 / ATCC MYA-4695 / CBS 11777 / NBRC 106824 / NRRL Y48691) TaxID=653667 RepID=S9W2I1_SCHCR|nr:tRNA specific adenosine deaminase [Schizosaccharomyces cryophilus OY26]EPY52629.1 tRNA specific adenosine deaminase [Schizosaccharomyces cryophilus OY26]